MAFGKHKQIQPDDEEFSPPSGENKIKIQKTKFAGKIVILISLGK